MWKLDKLYTGYASWRKWRRYEIHPLQYVYKQPKIATNEWYHYDDTTNDTIVNRYLNERLFMFNLIFLTNQVESGREYI